MLACKFCYNRRTRSLCLDDVTNICMNCNDIIKSGNYEIMITDDADVLHESVISEHCKKDPPTIINEYDENNSLPSLSSAIALLIRRIILRMLYWLHYTRKWNS